MTCSIRLDQDDAPSDILQHALHQAALTRSFGASKYKNMIGVIAVQQVVFVIFGSIEAWDGWLGEGVVRADESGGIVDFGVDREILRLKHIILIHSDDSFSGKQLLVRGLIRHNNECDQKSKCRADNGIVIFRSIQKLKTQ